MPVSVCVSTRVSFSTVSAFCIPLIPEEWKSIERSVFTVRDGNRNPEDSSSLRRFNSKGPIILQNLADFDKANKSAESAFTHSLF